MIGRAGRRAQPGLEENWQARAHQADCRGEWACTPVKLILCYCNCDCSAIRPALSRRTAYFGIRTKGGVRNVRRGAALAGAARPLRLRFLRRDEKRGRSE